MIPLFRKITHSELSSFSASLERPPEFDTPWHHHPEYELILILGGTGTRFMGDSISEFRDNELILVGPNLPHFWKESEHQKNPEAEAYVIHFTDKFLGKDFFGIPEAEKIKSLLERAKFGLKFHVEPGSLYVKKIKELFEKKRFDRILILLELLNTLAKSTKYEELSSAGFINFFTEKRSTRINRVFEYSITNFKESIDLDTVAKLIFMSKPAFCRFFKKSTGKTYFDFLKELRIGYACKLLQENNMSIIQVCYECGYESISNFNRQFKETLQTTPLHYRQNFGEENG
ncbi:MAG: AraC family transcriptional regulator [Chitinophagales bacterium]